MGTIFDTLVSNQATYCWHRQSYDREEQHSWNNHRFYSFYYFYFIYKEKERKREKKRLVFFNQKNFIGQDEKGT
jgi:hypothetical protein